MLVGLLVDELVAGRFGAHSVAPELVGAHGLVDPHVEHRAVVVGPGHPVGGVGDVLG